jgi:hypothetical protein
MKFTFDFSKCDRIFDELLKFGYIRINYTLPSADELKRRAYCKYHNSFSHATNDCNVFRRQVQSALSEGRLSLSDIQVDKVPFPMHAIEAGPPIVLICPEQADTTQGKNVLIGEPRATLNVQVNSGRKVMLEKDEEGKNKLKITAGSAQFLRRQRWHEMVAAQQRPARPTGAVGQADSTHQQSHSAELPQGVGLADSSTSAKSAEPTTPVGLADPPDSSSLGPSGVQVLRIFVPHRPKIGTWKTNKKKNQGELVVRPPCTFDRLMAKYKQEKADSENRPLKKENPHRPSEKISNWR